MRAGACFDGRFESLAAALSSSSRIRFTPETCRSSRRRAPLLRVISGLSAPQRGRLHAVAADRRFAAQCPDLGIAPFSEIQLKYPKAMA